VNFYPQRLIAENCWDSSKKNITNLINCTIFCIFGTNVKEHGTKCTTLSIRKTSTTKRKSGNCGKFTLTFRKKFYLYQKIIGTEVRNFEDRQNVM
jgi:hypothetical protein